ncbi:hypothetical protein CRUP_038109 [Coryphaenoides rupestris]|nr:hypothetical protein CRUP_038109 [Coryphaenoides rupestris]
MNRGTDRDIATHGRTELCHYYQRFYDAACTLGAYHPLLYEKNLVKRMNRAPTGTSPPTDGSRLPGLQGLNCTLVPGN